MMNPIGWPLNPGFLGLVLNRPSVVFSPMADRQTDRQTDRPTDQQTTRLLELPRTHDFTGPISLVLLNLDPIRTFQKLS